MTAEFTQEDLDSFKEMVENEAINLIVQRYEQLFNIVQLTIAYPHSELTNHDKLRAIILISLLSPDEELTEYLYSQLSDDEHKLIKTMRERISDYALNNY